MKSSRAVIAAMLWGAAAVGANYASAPVEAAAPASAYSPGARLAFFDGVEKSAPAAPLADEAGYRAIAEALRPIAPMSFASFAADGRGVVAKGVTIAFGDDLEAGLQIDELRLYGADPAKLAAKEALKSPAAALLVAKRIDARGFKTFGLEEWIEKANRASVEATIKAMQNSQSPLADEALAEMRKTSDVTAAVTTAERIVVDNLMLHGAEAQKAGSADGADNIGALMRGYAQFGRMMSFDALGMRNLKTDLKMGAPGGEMTASYGAGRIGMRGMRRGDLDESIVSGLTWSMSTPTPAAEGGASPASIEMSGGVDHYSVADFRLAKLLSYLVAGKTPPASEKALLSLGVWRSFGERYEIEGAPFYSLAESYTDLSQFQWFAPTAIKASVRSMTFDVGGLMKFGLSQAPADDPQAKQMQDMLVSLERHGFSKFDISSSVSDYLWSPENGKATLTGSAVIEKIGRVESRVDAGLPKFKALASLAPKSGEAFDAAAMSAMFADSTLTGFSARVVDQGVLERAFALMADLQGQATGAPAGSIKPADLRSASALAMRAAGAASPFGAVMAALGDFIAEGGAMTVTAKPKAPLPFVDLGKPGPKGEDPATRLGLAAERSAQ